MKTDNPVQKRKLIEVALPLEAINRESAREKAIRHGHPSTLHLWWARRPLAAARAVLFAQLVDDPSSHPEEFPTEELQRKERERLHKIIERLVVWENTRDEKLLAEAHAEILKSTNGNPPPILDPFAGGGTIPLEAQRLGLEAHASDLNPVPVLINKALIEIPGQFRDQPPVFPGLATSEIREWSGTYGLAADVRRYGDWMLERAREHLGHLYPEVDGRTAIAYIWARTVTCPNPGCGMETPLARSWWLGKKKGREAYIVPRVSADSTHPAGLGVTYEIGHSANGPSIPGTVSGRQGATCLACQASITSSYLKAEGEAGRIGSHLMAIALEGERKRIYVAPTNDQVAKALVDRPTEAPDAELAANSQYMGAPLYGMKTTSSLFTNRQLTTMLTFCDLVKEARQQVLIDGGTQHYADTIAMYLGLGVSRYSNFINSLCQWRPDAGKEQVGHLFARQAIPMMWDFAEANPFSNSAGGWIPAFQFVPKALEYLPNGSTGEVEQADASKRSYDGMLVSTDPPYYDNVPYADLSDFFYVWLRQTIRPIFPSAFTTITVPKDDELVANPQRHSGKEGAKNYFESGFRDVFSRIRTATIAGYPITVYYAFKQAETQGSTTTSTGWETLLEGMLQSGWAVTATWPLRSELGNRIRSIGSNALASSIVLALRPRSSKAPTTDRRSFVEALARELPDALRSLQQGQVAPVDLPQAAIGPGMAVFSRFNAVVEPDGSKMTVKSALSRINEILDQVLNEQEGDFDSTSRFAIAWYRQHGYGDGKYGNAELLANARGCAVQSMDRDGVLVSRGGIVHLIRPQELSWDYDVVADLHTSSWEVLHHLVKVLERDGITPAGEFLRTAMSRPDGAVEPDLVKELAHLLFRIAESKGWAKDALSFNSLVTSWPEILDVTHAEQTSASAQGAFDYPEED
ncbi:hypothetical protein A5746_20670 [Mycolicibacterium conceptionense]|uniref:DUF1156 domain-containing protein n=1 Tax=Mycolicibacterium conceptionense TaxID=451644 RepID=UPI0007EC6830|nr:DUF1156 domain-containing protein [Mycolicibacterium conceptionense]OBK03534.1 hypothetical protein A5639_22730 [Mycolicibacterium conceptionense]OMB68865.1 hypothetical protein A5741_09385 [Mycolicibacterium conceptionense]OMB91170.1 hypothetical protein A5746_20670 [Mycolicibacterium conceptionense]